MSYPWDEDDWDDDLIDDLVYSGASRSQREAETRAAVIQNEARWKREQAELVEAEAAAEQARIERQAQRLRERRAARRQAPSEPYTRQEVYERDEGRCYMCLRPLAPGWHIEHVVPLARGGTSSRSHAVAPTRWTTSEPRVPAATSERACRLPATATEPQGGDASSPTP